MTDITRKTVVEFEIVDHGIAHEQYFQGCGVAFTEFDEVVTGIGDNPAEAIDDCLEQMASNGWETDGMEARIIAQELPGKRTLPKTPRVLRKHGDEAHYYLSIRFKA